MSRRRKNWNKEFQRGARAAAGLLPAMGYRTTHPYLLEDCILLKLNMTTRRFPRENPDRLQEPKEAWLHGYAVALAEMHRLHGDSVGVCEAARNCGGLDLAEAERVGTMDFDLRELKLAGVPQIDPKMMTPHHVKWNKFVVTLEGPKGCNFRKENGETTWTCDHSHNLSRSILKKMGFNVDKSIDFFRSHGGYCDCEVLFNVYASVKGRGKMRRRRRKPSSSAIAAIGVRRRTVLARALKRGRRRAKRVVKKTGK